MTESRTRVAHIGIAVRALGDALPFYRDVLGLPEVPLDDADGANIIGLASGDALVELLEAGSPDSPVGRFVARRGRLAVAYTDDFVVTVMWRVEFVREAG